MLLIQLLIPCDTQSTQHTFTGFNHGSALMGDSKIKHKDNVGPDINEVREKSKKYKFKF